MCFEIYLLLLCVTIVSSAPALRRKGASCVGRPGDLVCVGQASFNLCFGEVSTPAQSCSKETICCNNACVSKMDNASCGVGMRNQKRLNDNLSPMLSLNIPTNQIASSYQTSKAIIYTFNAASSATVVDDPASINLAAMIPTASQTSVTSSQTTTAQPSAGTSVDAVLGSLKMTTTSTTQSPSSSPSVSISNQMSTTTTTSSSTTSTNIRKCSHCCNLQ